MDATNLTHGSVGVSNETNGTGGTGVINSGRSSFVMILGYMYTLVRRGNTG